MGLGGWVFGCLGAWSLGDYVGVGGIEITDPVQLVSSDPVQLFRNFDRPFGNETRSLA